MIIFNVLIYILAKTYLYYSYFNAFRKLFNIILTY